MRRLYIALLLAAISWSSPASAQVVDSSSSQLDEIQDDTADTVKHGVAFNSWSITTEVLMWWTKAAPCPVPLATTAPESALTNPADSYPPGNLANSDSTVVLGGQSNQIPLQYGGRFSLTRGLGDDDQFGIDITGFFSPIRTYSHNVYSDGTQAQFLTTPYTALDSVVFPAPGTPYANFLAGPASFSGGLTSFGFATLTQNVQFYGAEANGLWHAYEGEENAFHLIGGYRFFNVDELLSLQTFEFNNSYFNGQFINTLDRFKTRNYFNGGQIGFRWDWRSGNWFIGSVFKIAAGMTNEVVVIDGSTTTNSGAAYTQIPITTVPFGTFAQPSNIGTHTHNQFAWLPEINLKVGMQLSRSVRYYIGYNFMYLSNVARPGNQVDGTINPLQTAGFNGGLPVAPNGGGHPNVQIASSDFWLQGVTIGAEFGW